MVEKFERENKEKPENDNAFFELSDVKFSSTRSGGPGGQNVNKRETAIEARIPVDKLKLDDKQKQQVRKNFEPKHQYVEGEDAIFAVRSGVKSQKQAKELSVESLKNSIESALEKGRREEGEKKHKERVKKKQRKGGGGKKGSDRKRAEIEKGRRATKEDWIEQAMEEDPDMEDKLSND